MQSGSPISKHKCNANAFFFHQLFFSLLGAVKFNILGGIFVQAYNVLTQPWVHNTTAFIATGIYTHLQEHECIVKYSSQLTNQTSCLSRLAALDTSIVIEQLLQTFGLCTTFPNQRRSFKEPRKVHFCNLLRQNMNIVNLNK